MRIESKQLIKNEIDSFKFYFRFIFEELVLNYFQK